MTTLYKVLLRKEDVAVRTVLCTEFDDAREMAIVWSRMLRRWGYKEDEKTTAMFRGDWIGTTYFFKRTFLDVNMYSVSIDNHSYIEDGKLFGALD